MPSNKSTDITPVYTFTPTVVCTDSISLVSHSCDQSIVLLIQNVSRSEFELSTAGLVELDGVTKLNACQLEGSDFKYPVYRFKIHADGFILLRRTDGGDDIGIQVSAKTSEHDFQFGLACDVKATETVFNIRDSFVGQNARRSGQEYHAQSPFTDVFHRSTANIEAYASMIPNDVTTVGIQLRDKDSLSTFGPLEYPSLDASTFASTYTIYNDSSSDYYCVLEQTDWNAKPWLIFGYSALVGLAGLLPFGTTWSALAFGWGTVVSLLATLDPGRPDANTFARFLPRGSYLQKTAGYVHMRLIKTSVSAEGVLQTSQTPPFTNLGAPAVNNLMDPLKNWLDPANFMPIGLPVLLQVQTRGLETLLALKVRNMKTTGSVEKENYSNVFTFIEKWARNDLLLFQPTLPGRPSEDQRGAFWSSDVKDTGDYSFDGNRDGYTIFLITTAVRPGKPRILYRQDGFIGLLLENYEITGGDYKGADALTESGLYGFINYFKNTNPTSAKAGVSTPSDIPMTVFHHENSTAKLSYTRYTMASATKIGRIRPSSQSNIIVGIDHSATFRGKDGSRKDNSLLAVQKLMQ